MTIKKLLSWLSAVANIQCTTNDLTDGMDQKVNTSLYNSDQKHLVRELDQIQAHLKRIEGKIDGLCRNYQNLSQ